MFFSVYLFYINYLLTLKMFKTCLYLFIMQKISHLQSLLMQAIFTVQSIGDFAISGHVIFFVHKGLNKLQRKKF